MKNWKQLFEHHDEEWPEELLTMTVDQLLDKLKLMGLDSEYETVESILKGSIMIDDESGLPTFDEIIKEDPMASMAKADAERELRFDTVPSFDEMKRKEELAVGSLKRAWNWD